MAESTLIRSQIFTRGPSAMACTFTSGNSVGLISRGHNAPGEARPLVGGRGRRGPAPGTPRPLTGGPLGVPAAALAAVRFAAAPPLGPLPSRSIRLLPTPSPPTMAPL